MQRSSFLFGLAFLLISSILAGGCRPQAALYSESFSHIFLYDTTTFRGVNLGDPISSVEQQEAPEKPDHMDELGLSYTLELAQGRTLLVDYFTDAVSNPQTTERLTSIVANILIEDEVETAIMYNEIRNYFNRQYGVSSGVFGDLVWETSTYHTSSMEVRLVLHESKVGIRLNFIDRLSANAAP